MDAVLEGLDAAARAELTAIRAQFERLAEDRWRDCEACGAPIGDGRLRAVPTADRCVGCAD